MTDEEFVDMLFSRTAGRPTWLTSVAHSLVSTPPARSVLTERPEPPRPPSRSTPTVTVLELDASSVGPRARVCRVLRLRVPCCVALYPMRHGMQWSTKTALAKWRSMSSITCSSSRAKIGI